MGERMEQPISELADKKLTRIIAMNEKIPTNKVDEVVERFLKQKAKEGVIRYGKTS